MPREQVARSYPGFWTLAAVLGLYVALGMIPGTCYSQFGTGGSSAHVESEAAALPEARR